MPATNWHYIKPLVMVKPKIAVGEDINSAHK